MAGKRGRPKKVTEKIVVIPASATEILTEYDKPVPPVLGQGIGSMAPLSTVAPSSEFNEAREELLYLAKSILIEMIAKTNGKVHREMAAQAVEIARLLIKLTKEAESESGQESDN